jgi:hypothetical protein
MRPFFLPICLPTTCYIIIALFLQRSQVRSQTLNGDISIFGAADYQNMKACPQGCLYLEPLDGKNGLVDILGCDLPVPNACYCRTDQLQLATNAISSCITADCTNVDNIDISTAIQVYNNYCSSVSAEDLVITTDTMAGASKSPSFPIS